MIGGGVGAASLWAGSQVAHALTPKQDQGKGHLQMKMLVSSVFSTAIYISLAPMAVALANPTALGSEIGLLTGLIMVTGPAATAAQNWVAHHLSKSS